jgi:hypothetical protein
MGYDLHITRADYWPDHAMYPISLQERIAIADAEPRITKYQGDGKQPIYAYTSADGTTDL